MPLYDFTCDHCLRVWDEFVSHSCLNQHRCQCGNFARRLYTPAIIKTEIHDYQVNPLEMQMHEKERAIRRSPEMQTKMKEGSAKDLTAAGPSWFRAGRTLPKTHF